MRRLSKESVINCPVYLSKELQQKVENKPKFEDVEGRTWDIVFMLKCAIAGKIPTKKIGSEIYYQLILNDPKSKGQKLVWLKAILRVNLENERIIIIDLVA